LTGVVAPTAEALFSVSAADDLARRRRRTLFALKIIVVSVVVLQRFAVPGLTTALCAPIVLAVTVYLVSHDLLVEDPGTTGGYLIAVTLCCLSTVVTSTAFGIEPSLTSLALLLVLYVPFCFRLRTELTGLYRNLLEFFNRLMVVLAMVALIQWAAQLAGWRYIDPLAVLPRRLLLQTYNTFYPIYYGSTIMKTNAVVFLEPSFCSQYLALALVVQLLLGRHRWRLVLYAAALATTLSGTGLLLLALGVSVLMIRRGGRWAVRVLIVLGVVGVLISLSPLARIIGPRLSETTTTNTSGNARFIAPYVQVADGLATDVPSMLFGRGPGAVSRSTGSAFFNPTGVEVNYAVVPKLAAEYGLIAATAFIVFIGWAIAGRARSPTIVAALLLLYLVLSGSLLQPATVYTCLVLGSFFRVPLPRWHPPPPPGGASVLSVQRTPAST
jgi:hypothetical protein